MEGGAIPPLRVVGDVRNPLVLTDLEGFAVQSLLYGEVYGVPLSFILQQAFVEQEEFSLWYVAQGLLSQGDATHFNEHYLVFSPLEGWAVLHRAHPLESRIKHLEEILILTESFAFHFGIFTPTENLVQYSVGELHRQRKKEFFLYELVDKEPDENTFLIGDKGEMHRYEEGYFEVTPNRVDFHRKSGQGSIEHVKGVVFDAPSTRITDVFHDALSYLKEDYPVLVMILDGLAYYQYAYAVSEGYLPFLAKNGEAKRALSVYPPVTNAGLAAILTGVGPEQNGVHSRRERSLLALDIFERARELGKQSAYIVGDRQIIRVSQDPIFNVDQNQNGSTDDEIIKTAIGHLAQDMSLVVVHLKDIDRAGHNYGPLHPFTLAVILETDRALKHLVSLWDGIVLVTADHGMHTTLEGGNHGTLRFEDMVVPYLKIRRTP